MGVDQRLAEQFCLEEKPLFDHYYTYRNYGADRRGLEEEIKNPIKYADTSEFINPKEYLVPYLNKFFGLYNDVSLFLPEYFHPVDHGVPEDIAPEANKIFTERINKVYAIATKLRKQLLFSPIPTEPLKDWQQLYLSLDPVSRNFKNQVKNFLQFIETEEQKRGLNWQADYDATPDPMQQIVSQADALKRELFSALPKFKNYLQKFIGSSAPLNSDNAFDFLTCLDNEYSIEDRDYYHDSNSTMHIIVPSCLKHTLTYLFGKDSKEYSYYYNHFVDNYLLVAKSLKLVLSVTSLGYGYIEFARLIDAPKEWKQSVTEDGEALVKRFDLNGKRRFILKYMAEPFIHQFIKNLDDPRLLWKTSGGSFAGNYSDLIKINDSFHYMTVPMILPHADFIKNIKKSL